MDFWSLCLVLRKHAFSTSRGGLVHLYHSRLRPSATDGVACEIVMPARGERRFHVSLIANRIHPMSNGSGSPIRTSREGAIPCLTLRTERRLISFSSLGIYFNLQRDEHVRHFVPRLSRPRCCRKFARSSNIYADRGARGIWPLCAHFCLVNDRIWI